MLAGHGNDSVVTQDPSPARGLVGTPGGGEDGGGGQPVPEPSTLLLVGTGLVGVALSSRWRRRRPKIA